MEALGILGVALGIPLVTGLNLYATVLTIGLLIRLDLVTLAPHYAALEVFGSDWVIGIAAGLYLIEFVADKVPWVDTAWDAIHTFIRVPAGAALALVAVGEVHPAVQVCAFLLGGGVALAAHSTKAAVRIAANASPEPVSNSILSLTEDALVVGGTALALTHPVIMGVLAAFCLFGMSVFLWKALRLGVGVCRRTLRFVLGRSPVLLS